VVVAHLGNDVGTRLVTDLLVANAKYALHVMAPAKPARLRRSD
jgi:hypothetical protein